MRIMKNCAHMPLLFFMLLTTETLLAVDLAPFIRQIEQIRDQLVGAIDGLRVGKEEMGYIYQRDHSGLKPQLLDNLDKVIQQTQGNVKDIKNSLKPLKKLPFFVKKTAVTVANIADLEPTLTWIIDKPLSAIISYLKQTYETFHALGEKIRPGSSESAPLYDHFTHATAKLQKAVCRIEKTLAALKEDYVIPEQCKK